MRSLTCLPSRNFCVIIAILGLWDNMAKYFTIGVKMLSFEKYKQAKRDFVREKSNRIPTVKKATLWEEENAEAISEQNERVTKRGVFGDRIRKF